MAAGMTAGRPKAAFSRAGAAVGELLRRRARTLAVAESCTGGLVSHMITQAPGSSGYFLGGIVAYANDAKVSLLGVRASTLERRGAVSGETAAEMAAGARRAFGADIGLAATGIAGPGGGSEEKPVGLVYIAVAAGRGRPLVRRCRFTGGRAIVKERAAAAALALLARLLRDRGERP
ncbi:MAG: nicotinamide-nucleotide amidohydrolase family protein [bacterium]|nr:nicotinamide-nucleotide amidohydrolase family protein [bacterium]